MKDTRNGENMDYNNTITENYNEVPGPNKANALQITGLVLSIVGIVVCCCLACGGLVLGIAGLVCSIIGNNQNGRNGIGTAGMVCGIVAIVLSIINMILGGIITSTGLYQEIMNNLY